MIRKEKDMSVYIGNNNKIKNSIIGNNQNILFLIKKGDIITYDSGKRNFVNKPFKYQMYFDTNMYNSNLNLRIIKIQRYIKVLWFYKLKTIYSED
jgi:hypothetical protein